MKTQHKSSGTDKLSEKLKRSSYHPQIRSYSLRLEVPARYSVILDYRKDMESRVQIITRYLLGIGLP